MPFCIRRVFPESSRYARQVFHPHPVPSRLKGWSLHILDTGGMKISHNNGKLSPPPLMGEGEGGGEWEAPSPLPC